MHYVDHGILHVLANIAFYLYHVSDISIFILLMFLEEEWWVYKFSVCNHFFQLLNQFTNLPEVSLV